MGEVWRFTWHNIRRLLTSPRLYLSLFVVYTCLRLCFGDVGAALAGNNQTIQAVELMIFAFASRIPQWMLTFGMLLLLGDAPFLHEGMSVYLVRSSRVKWLLGQILFCLVTVVCYLFAVELMLLTMSGSGVSFANQWSAPVRLACRVPDGASFLSINMGVSFPMNIVQSGSPWPIFALTVLYDALLLSLFAMLCLTLNARWKTGTGCFAVTALLLLRVLIENSVKPDKFRVISPCNLAALGSELVTATSFGYRLAFFLCACGLLGVWGYSVLRSADLAEGMACELDNVPCGSAGGYHPLRAAGPIAVSSAVGPAGLCFRTGGRPADGEVQGVLPAQIWL